MIMLLHFWLRVLICCLGLWGFTWLASIIRKSKQEEGLINPIMNIRIVTAHKLETALSNMSKIAAGIAAGLLVGLTVGYEIRGHEFTDNSQTYTSVSIITKFADRDFLIWPDRMKQQRIQICPESIVDWYEGEILSDWTFEQKKGCKRVVLYHEDRKGEKLNVKLR